MENLNNDDISLCLKSKVSYNMNRHIKLLQEKAENYTLANEKIYRVYNGAIRSYGPISDDYTLSEADEDRVMACLKQNILLTTNGFSYNSPKTWYAVIANRYESYDKYPSKIRSQFKRSYANCQVERISAKWLSKNGWQVYRDAFMRYKDYRGEIWDSNLFENKIALYQDYEDIVHCWGCFVNKELAGFSINNVYGK